MAWKDDARWQRARSAVGHSAHVAVRTLRASGGVVWRFVRAMVIGVVGLYLVYLIGVNIALRAMALPNYLDDSEEEVRIHYGSAWTYWPGKVQVDDLVVAIQDSSMQAEIRSDHASGTIGLFALLERKAIFSGIRASAVTVRFRSRRTEADATAAERALPPIPTWGALSLKDPAATPKTDSQSLWRIVLDDVGGTVSEVWVEEVRITGRMRVRGTFDFSPLEKLDLEHVRGTLDGVRIEVMGKEDGPFADDIDGAFRFNVLDFDVAANEIVDIVRFADIDADLRAMLYPDRVAKKLSPDVNLEDGSGAATLRAAARKGRLLRGSRAFYETAHLGVAGGPVSGKANDAVLDVEAVSDEDVNARVIAESVDLHLVPAPKSLIHVERPFLSIDGKMVPHFMKPTFEGGEASIPAANMGLAGLDGVAEGVRFRKGIAFARAHAVVDRNGHANGEGHSRVEDLDAVIMGVGITGRSTSELSLDEARLVGDPSIRVRSFLTLDRVGLKAGKERVDNWWARLELGSHFARQGDQPWAIDASALGRFRDAAPMVAILDGENLVPGIVADQLLAEGLVAKTSIQVRGPRVQVDLADATGHDVRVRGRMVVIPKDYRASWLVQTDLIDTGISLVRGRTPQIQILAGEGWLNRERTFLGSFARGGAAPHPPEPTVR